MIWFLLAVIATLVALALILPFLSTRRLEISDGLGVFNGQLAELQRDRELGLISEDESRRAEAEIKRRLLRASEQVEAEGEISPALRQASIVICTLTVAAAVAIYMWLGSPHLIGEPSVEQPSLTEEQVAFINEVDALASDLLANPDNAPGWAGLGQAYMVMGRYGEAAIAFNNAINLVPDSSALFASLGEAYLYAEGGNFNPSAREAFQRAYDLDPQNVRARFFIAEAIYQSGDQATAERLWQELIASVPEGDPAWAMIQRRLETLGTEP